MAYPSSPHVRKWINCLKLSLWVVCVLWLNSTVCSLKDLKCYHNCIFILLHFQLLCIFFKWLCPRIIMIKDSGSLAWLDCGPACMPQGCIKPLKQGWSLNALILLGCSCQARTHAFHWKLNLGLRGHSRWRHSHHNTSLALPTPIGPQSPAGHELWHLTSHCASRVGLIYPTRQEVPGLPEADTCLCSAQAPRYSVLWVELTQKVFRQGRKTSSFMSEAWEHILQQKRTTTDIISPA